MRTFLFAAFLLWPGLYLHAQTYDSTWINAAKNRLGILYQNGNYKVLLDATQDCLDTARTRYGDQSLEVAHLLYDLSDVQKFTGDFATAEKTAEACLENYTLLLGLKSRECAETLNQLGFIRYRLGKLDAADSLYRESEATFVALGMNPSWQLASLYSDMASVYQDRGLWLDAEQAHLKALQTAEATPDMPESTYGVLLNNIGIFYAEMHRGDLAIRYLNEYIAFLKKTLPANHPVVLKTLSNHGYTYLQEGRYREAQEIIGTALRIGRETYPPGDVQLAYLLRKQAALDMRVGRYQEAIALLEEAQAAYKAKFGDGHPAYSITLRELATAMIRGSNDVRADTILQEAIAIMERDNRTQTFAYAQALINQGILYQKQGNLSRAHVVVAKGTMLGEKLLGADNPGHYQSFGSVWVVQNLLENQPDVALAYLDSVQALILNTYGPNHQASISIASQYGVAWQLKGNASQSLTHFQQAFSGLQFNLYENLPFLATEEREQFADAYEVHRKRFHAAARTFSDDPAFAAFLFDVQLFQKNLLASFDRQQLVDWQQHADTLYETYADVRRMIARQWSMPEKERYDLPRLEKKRSELEQKMALQSGPRIALYRPVRWTEVQSALNPGEAVLEWLLLPGENAKEAAVYAVLILRPGMKAPKMVVLADAASINTRFASGNNRGLTYASQTYGSDVLYRALWQPMEQELQGVTSVVYAPVGALHLLNFEAIKTQNGALLCEKYRMTRVTNTACLLDPRFRENEGGRGLALLLGGLDYDVMNRQDTPAPAELASRGTVFRGGTGVVKQWSPLPETLPEVEQVKILVQRRNQAVLTLTGAEGTETAFKNRCSNEQPSVIHLATHGFFFQKGHAESTDLGLLAADNPMFRSGLILAGANPSWRGESGGNPSDDGILTADEICLLPLGKTDLVVLSACETGLGDVDDTEGVYGLQRAFRLAGAQNIIMSLWRVPDLQTREFMEAFYTFWLESGDAHRAFSQAREKVRKTYSNPYYWAGFVLLE